jgi:hypothetical protein
MTLDQVKGLLQVLIPTLLAYAVGKGWVAQSQVADITAAIVMLVSAAYSAVTTKTK